MQPCARSQTHAARANFIVSFISQSNHEIEKKSLSLRLVFNPRRPNFQHDRPGSVNSTLAFVICHA